MLARGVPHRREAAFDGLQRELPTVRHRIAAVDAEVDDARFPSCEASANVRQRSSRQHGFEADILPDRAAAADPTSRAPARSTSSGRGSSGCWRENASSREVNCAPRCAPSIALTMKRSAFLVVGTQVPLGDVERADDDREHVVEVMRDAARQLADRFHFLHLSNLRFGRGPRCRLVAQALIGRLKSLGAFANAHLEFRVQPLAAAFRSLRIREMPGAWRSPTSG